MVTYDVMAITYNGEKQTVHMMSQSFRDTTISAFMRCEDVKTVIVVNGLTGEILQELNK